MDTNNAVVDDCGQSSLLSSEAVQVQSQTLEEALSAQQEQTRAERVIWMRERQTPHISSRSGVEVASLD